MPYSLPPIQWISTFESVARNLSFKAAVAELSVSAPAISQQIKLLEEYLGVSLFKRNNRNITLTEPGHCFYKLAFRVVNEYFYGFQNYTSTNSYKN